MKKTFIQCLIILVFLPFKGLAQIPTSGLVAFYPFNGNAKDVSGNNNNGQIFGATLAPDRCSSPDSAYLFNGIDNYILIKNSPSLNFSNEITLCAWIKPVSLRGHGNSAIISKGYYSHVDPFYQYHLGITGDTYPNLPARFSIALSLNGRYEVLTGDSLWLPNRWYFVAGTYDGSMMKLYLNGALIAKYSISGSIDIYDEPVCIGRTKNYPGRAYTPGTIDDARIYNRALSESEIKALYYSNCNLTEINGPLTVCQNQKNVNYYISPISNADTYTWKYSGTGAFLNDSLNNVSIDFTDNATGGDLSVAVSGIDYPVQTASIPIQINTPPSDAGAIVGLNEVCQNTGEIPFAVSVVNSALSYEWTYSGDGVSIQGSSNQVNLYFFNNATSGNLSVRGVNDCGSGSFSEDFPIIVKSCSENPGNLHIPNAFSPNGDGVNDAFVIQGLASLSQLLIFDRTGKKRYQSDNYLNDWDGKDSDGEAMQSDTYWYILVVPGFQNEFKGFVYLKK